MASLSKASQEALRALKPWLGFANRKNKNSEERDLLSQPSFSSGSTTLLGSERSRSVQTGDWKHGSLISHAQDKGWSKTLRSVVSLFYVEEEGGVQNSSLNCSPKTPERKNPRSPLRALSWNKSSTKSRRSLRTRDQDNVPVHDKSANSSPTWKTPERAPRLDIKIPNHSLNETIARNQYTNQKTQANDQDDLHAVKNSDTDSKNPMLGPTLIWPRSELRNTHETKVDRFPSNITFLEDPYLEHSANGYQDEKQSTGLLRFEPTSFDEAPNVQGLDAAEDKGYASDVESNNELESLKAGVCPALRATSSFDNTSRSRYDSPALQVRFSSSASPQEKAAPKARHSRQSEGSDSGRPISPIGLVEGPIQGLPTSPKNPRKSLSLRKSLDYLRNRIVRPFTSSQKEMASNLRRLPSYAYDADAELSEPSPPLPSMGPRGEWEKMRSERNQRYIETIKSASATSDGKSSFQPHQSRSTLGVSPSDSPAVCKVDLEQPSYERKLDDGLLRFAIEAIERPNADQIQDDESKSSSSLDPGFQREDSGLPFAGGKPRTPSYNITRGEETMDPFNQSRQVSSTSVFRQAWELLEGDLLPFADVYDPYQAALTAAGLTSGAASQSRFSGASGVSDDDSLYSSQPSRELFRSTEAKLPDERLPSHIVPGEIWTENRESLEGPGASTSGKSPEYAPIQAAPHSDLLDKMKGLPLRPKLTLLTTFGQAQPLEQSQEHNATTDDAGISQTAALLRPRVCPTKAPVDMTLREVGGWAIQSAYAPKTDPDSVLLSEQIQSPHSSSLSEQRRPGSPYFESGFFIMPNDSAFWHDRDFAPLPPPLSPLLDTDTDPLITKEDTKAASSSSSGSREQLGLVKHLQEKGARNLMQLVYNLEAEAEAEDKDQDGDWVSESEVSRNDTISID